jgi:hypothetical protein
MLTHIGVSGNGRAARLGELQFGLGRPPPCWELRPTAADFGSIDAGLDSGVEAKSSDVGDLRCFAQISTSGSVKPPRADSSSNGRIGKMGREHHAIHARRQYVSSVCALMGESAKIDLM